MEKVRIILFVSICMGGAFLYHITQCSQHANEVILENIEALADSESSPNVRCRFTGSVECPGSKEKVKEVKTFSLALDYE